MLAIATLSGVVVYTSNRSMAGLDERLYTCLQAVGDIF